MSVKTLAKVLSSGDFATGTYIGDNAATQAITGVGFQPRAIFIYEQQDPVGNWSNWGRKADVDGIMALIDVTGAW